MTRTPVAVLGGVILVSACAPAEQRVDADRSPVPSRAPSRTAPQPAPPPERAVTRPAPPRPPRRRPAELDPRTWAKQRAAWKKLREAVTPLARRGAPLPTEKLRKHFRLRGWWHVPSFDRRKLPQATQRLLTPGGPAAGAAANGPAGRQVWVEVAGPRLLAGRSLADTICRLAAGCGLACTRRALASATPKEAAIRRLVRLRADHDVVLLVRARAGAPAISAVIPDKATDDVGLARRIRAALTGLGDAVTLRQRPLSRVALGLTVAGDPARLDRDRQVALARALCRLADRLPDRLHQAWGGTDARLRKRGQALARWLGLTFVDKPVHARRPKMEHRYVRKHYRDRVFNWRRRADGAYLIDPLMVVLHHTGGLSLRSALYTLTSLKLGSRAGYRNPGSLGVGVPYLVARDGTLYRLFKDDHRFGRHTIGLNHSAVGIENVGTRRSGLSKAQLAVNVKLVQYLALRYPLRYLLGHRDVYQMARTPYFLEAVPGYCSNKSDPNRADLRAVRRAVAGLGLGGPPTARPLLRSCRDLRRYFKRRRRAARRP